MHLMHLICPMHPMQVRDIKEKLCYVAQDYAAELAAATSSSAVDKVSRVIAD